MSEYIYIVQEREFVNNKKPIYKIGGTTQVNGLKISNRIERVKLLMQIVCTDSRLIEKKIIKVFRDKYIWKKKLGRKYFKGDPNTMMSDIYNIVQKMENKQQRQKNYIDDSSDYSDLDSHDINSIDEDYTIKPKILDLVSESDDSDKMDVDTPSQPDDSIRKNDTRIQNNIRKTRTNTSSSRNSYKSRESESRESESDESESESEESKSDESDSGESDSGDSESESEDSEEFYTYDKLYRTRGKKENISDYDDEELYVTRDNRKRKRQ